MTETKNEIPKPEELSDDIEEVKDDEDDEGEDEEQIIHPIAFVMDEFVHTVLDIRECVERLVPIAIDELNDEADTINKKFDEGFELLEKSENPNDEILAIKSIEQGKRLSQRFKRSNIIDTLIKSLFINLFSSFDKLTGDLLTVLYSKNPDLYKSINKDVSLSEVLRMNSLDDLKDIVLDGEIETLRRKSYIEQFKDLEKRFSINLTKFKTWPMFIEAAQRRNLFTHCDGVVSAQYLKTCKDIGHKNHKEYIVGDQLKVDPEYFYMACIVVTEVGVMLGQTLWRKTLPDEISDADNHLHRLIYDFLDREDWGVAIRISQFAKDLPKHSDEIIRRINIINYAIALTYVDRKEAAISLLEKEEWAGMIPDFKLAVAVLKENDIEAIDLMKKIGNEGEMVHELAYHEWPLFKEFRSKDCFLNTYNEIYGYPFIEKLNELVEETKKESAKILAEETNESSNKSIEQIAGSMRF